MGFIDVSSEIDSELVNLARLAASGSTEDVRLYLAKLVRKHRVHNPELAAKLDQALKTTQTRSTGPSVLRRNTAQHGTDLLPMDAESRMSLIRVFDDLDGLDTPILASSLMEQISAITKEREQLDRLAAHGIDPTKSAIFVGPPGVGKTLSARWIAAQIGKPLWVLDLTTVMSSLLGKTGSNLRAVFEHAKSQGAVLLLDEIDAIAKRRSDDSDVGELKRLVTAILQEVDSWPSNSLLLAATNHPELIDPALWRRFDVVLTFEIGTGKNIESAVRRFLGKDIEQFEPFLGVLAASLAGRSLSEVERAILTMRRHAVLTRSTPGTLVGQLAMYQISSLDKQAKMELAIALALSETMSYNQISDVTGISRDTLRKYAGPSKIKGRGTKKG